MEIVGGIFLFLNIHKMSKTKFTPGPWETDLAIGTEYENFRCIKAGVGYFSMTGGDPNGGFNMIAFISKENADLMTAAPDLYEALENMVECFSVFSNADQANAHNDAKAALDKARGE